MFADLLAALVHEQHMAGDGGEPRQAPTHLLALLVEREFEPRAERKVLDLFQPRLFLGRQRQPLALGLLQVFAEPGARLQPHRQFGAGGGGVVVGRGGGGFDEALRQEILSSLAQVGYHEDEAAAIAQRLVEPGAGVEDDSTASRTELTMRLKARSRLGEELQQAKRKRLSLSPEEQARLEQIKHLPFGTWFEFTLNQQGERVRRRLSWFSTVTGHVLFVNQRGQKIGEHTLEGLARAMVQNQVRVIEDEKGTLIDRAWGAVMGALRTFAGGQGKEAPAR